MACFASPIIQKIAFPKTCTGRNYFSIAPCRVIERPLLIGTFHIPPLS